MVIEDNRSCINRPVDKLVIRGSLDVKFAFAKHSEVVDA